MDREKITTRAHGIDISQHQIERGATKIQDKGYNPNKTTGQTDFAIAKVGQGYNTPYRTREGAGDGDRDFRLLWDGVSQIPIRGVYFYQDSKGYSWKQQADLVLQYITKLEVQPHILALDVEKIGNTLDKSFFADSLRILDYWKDNSSYKVIMYSGNDIVNNYLIPIGTKAYGKEWVNRIMAYPQWQAQYWFRYSPDKNPDPYKGYPNWDIYQYTASGDSFINVGGEKWRHYGSPDLNVYNGTVEEMRQWLGLATPANPEHPSDGGDVPSPAKTYEDGIKDGRVQMRNQIKGLVEGLE